MALRESVFLQWRVGHFNPHPEPVRLSQFDTGFGGKSRPGVQSQIRTTMYVVRCPCGMKLSWGKYVEDGETGAGHLRMTWCDEEHMTQEKMCVRCSRLQYEGTVHESDLNLLGLGYQSQCMSMLVNVDVAVLPRTRMHGCVDSMSMCTHVSVCV